MDRILVSPAVAPWCGRLRVDWGTGLPVHAALELELAVPCGGRVLRVRPGERVDGPARAGWEDDEDAADARARARWEGAGRRALAAGRVADAWRSCSAR